jgi:peptidoglycan/xylan/chitin deacetylase (PgdA/CDA1 family)
VDTRRRTITFHGIGTPTRELEPGEADYWLSRDRFHDVLDAVAGHDDVRITFDDGNASDVELALPALRERGLRATFFVVADRIGAKGFLHAGDIRELTRAGMTVGCHGMLHRRWAGLDRGSLHEELFDAREIIERIAGVPVLEAACPYGSYDRRAIKSLRYAGYLRVYTSDRGTARLQDFLQARYTVLAGDGSDLLERIGEPDGASIRSWARRGKQVVKRWR